MANTVTSLSYANTFGDWVVTTNALVNEIDAIGYGNWQKPTGYLSVGNNPSSYVPPSGTAILATQNTIIYGTQLQVTGTGSSATIQNNLTVTQGQVYFSNTTLGLTNAGQANIGGPLLALGSGYGLQVSNDALVSGNVVISGFEAVTGNLSVVGPTQLNNTLLVFSGATVNSLQSNVSVNTTTLTVTGNSFTNTLQANSSVNTSTLTVTGNTFTNTLQANSSVNTATLSVTGGAYVNTLQANNSVNTATLTVTGTGYHNIVQANSYSNTATAFITGTSYQNAVQANTYVNTAILSVTGGAYVNTLQANASVNTATLSVTGSSYVNTLQANASINTATLTVTGNTFTNILQANSYSNTATAFITGTSYQNAVQANSSVNTATLSVTGGSYVNTLQANASVNTATLSVTGSSYVNTLQANTSINTASLVASSSILGNNIQSNNSITSVNSSVTNTAYINNLVANTSINACNATMTANTLTVGTGGLSVIGNFTINGSTVYNTPTFVINALTPNQTAYFGVYRSPGANAYIKWDQANTYWSIADVSGNSYYYRVLTTQQIVDNLTSTSTITTASANTANALNNNINTANTFLQNQIAANVAYIAGVDSTQNTNITDVNNYSQTAFARANTSANAFTGTTGTAYPSSGIISFSGTNGVTITGSGSTLTISEPQNLQTSASPTFNGLTLTSVATSVTPATNTSNTMIATTAFVQNQMNNGNTYTMSVSGNAGTVTNGVYTTGSYSNPSWITSLANSKITGLATSATTDTTNASNISSGTLGAARLPAFTGDITTSAGSSATTLATVNSNVGTFGGAATVPVYTVNGKGLITAASNVAIAISSSAVSGLAASATTDTTNASNITSGTLPNARLSSVPNSSLANSSLTVNGVSISLGGSGTVTASAGTLTGSTLASGVTASSLTSVGTLANLTVTNTITGSVSGNAGTVTNGVYTNGSYSNPTWIISLASSKITGTIPAANISGLAASATTDTTNASNITSGTLPSGRLSGSYSIDISGNAGNITGTYGGSLTSSQVTTALGFTPASSTGTVQFAGGQPIIEYQQAITSNYTITSGTNALSAGPITVNTGVTVTVPNGSRWVIV